MKTKLTKREIVFLEDFSLNKMGGGQKISSILINKLNDHNITVIHLGDANIFKKTLKNDNINFKEIKINKIISRKFYLFYLIIFLYSNNYKYVYANTRITSLSLQILGCFLRKRTYIIVQHLSPRYPLFINILARYFTLISNCKYLVVTKFLMNK